MKKHWWKMLSVLILLYVFTVGLLVPLKPGITGAVPQSLKMGNTVVVMVNGYNSHYASAASNRAWLKLDEKYSLAAKEVRVQDEQTLTMVIDLPTHFPGDKKVREASILIDNEIDGSSVFPGAVFLTQDATHGSAGDLWLKSPISDLHTLNRMTFPFRNILAETVRNTYFHVPLWFGMILLFLTSVIYSIRYLRHMRREDDWKASAFTKVGVLFGFMGLVTGALWAKWTWGAFWSWDIKQNMSAIAMLIYLAYFVLRSSFDDMEQQARISAVFNIFAFAALIPLLFVIPRLTDSLHPGNGGNPGFGGEDLDHTMRMVFYPAIIGWTLLGVWMANLAYRLEGTRERLYEKMES